MSIDQNKTCGQAQSHVSLWVTESQDSIFQSWHCLWTWRPGFPQVQGFHFILILPSRSFLKPSPRGHAKLLDFSPQEEKQTQVCAWNRTELAVLFALSKKEGAAFWRQEIKPWAGQEGSDEKEDRGDCKAQAGYLSVHQSPDSLLYFALKITSKDFPGVPVVKKPPSNAGDVRLIPGRGTKILYPAEQLSLCIAETGSRSQRLCSATKGPTRCS